MAPGVTDHNGDPIPANAEFFAPPPPEIGEVLTASSSLPLGKQPMAGSTRSLICGGLAGVTVFGMMVLGWNNNPPPAPQTGSPPGGTGTLTGVFTPEALIGLVLGGLVYWGATYFTRFDHTCSYVGRAGVARLRLRASRQNALASEVFLFEDASELRTSRTRSYYNGIYTGTTYSFKWTNEGGRTLFMVSGSYSSKQDTPRRTDKSWLPRAAEFAWNEHLVERMNESLDENGWVQFNLKGKDFVRVGRGFFEFGMRGEVARIEADEIKSLNLNGGTFSIQHKDAKWFSSKGKFSFSYATMANAQGFLLAMKSLTGYHFE